MLRIAGPFAYEDDAFHDACDALGLLVWQDFMFANLDYPSDDPEFLATVSAEAGVGRRAASAGGPALRCSAGTARWSSRRRCSGSSASSGAARSSPRCSRPASAPGRTFPTSASSPSGGALPFQPGDGRGATTTGSGAYRRPLEDARRAEVKFASECLAFANVPARRTVEALLGMAGPSPTDPSWKARVPRDRGAGWDFEDVRDFYLADALRGGPRGASLRGSGALPRAGPGGERRGDGSHRRRVAAHRLGLQRRAGLVPPRPVGRGRVGRGGLGGSSEGRVLGSAAGVRPARAAADRRGDERAGGTSGE